MIVLSLEESSAQWPENPTSFLRQWAVDSRAITTDDLDHDCLGGECLPAVTTAQLPVWFCKTKTESKVLLCRANSTQVLFPSLHKLPFLKMGHKYYSSHSALIMIAHRFFEICRLSCAYSLFFPSHSLSTKQEKKSIHATCPRSPKKVRKNSQPLDFIY